MLFNDEVADVFTYIGYSTSHCGYCDRDDTFHTFGVWAHSLSAKTYKVLVDRGWRRSGMYLYRPNLRRSCCQLYTIKLDAQKFKPDKKQRQALNKFNRYVFGDDWEERKKLSKLESFSEAETTQKQSHKPSINPHKSPTFNLSTTVHLCDAPLELRPAHEFQVITEPAAFSAEKFELYKAYQVAVHGDKEEEVTASSFERFLCDSPIQAESSPGRDHGYGSFHQRYMLDDKLIGLAVLDLLPGCISSVYFAYSPAFAFSSLGRVSACREAQLAVENMNGPTDDYYMGYFVPSCPKMKYKGEYRPSQLLDPLALPINLDDRWFKLEAYEKVWRQRRQGVQETETIDYFVSFLKKDDALEQDIPSDLTTPGTIFAASMPGILPLADVQGMNLDGIMLLSDGGVELASYSRAWKRRERRNAGQIRDFIATMGPDIVSRAIFTID